MAEVLGVGISADFEALFMPLPGFSAGLSFGYLQYPGTGGTARFRSLAFGAMMEKGLPLANSLDAFFQGRFGAGYSSLDFSDTGREPSTGLHPFIDAGAGLQFRVGTLGLRVQGTYRIILEEGPSPYHGLAIMVGLRAGL
jgi:hypothetical protein